MSIYVILDTPHADYITTISMLVGISAKSFSPRLSIDGNKALLQIKDEVKLDRVFFARNLQTMYLGSGDEAWARTQVNGPEWKDENLD